MNIRAINSDNVCAALKCSEWKLVAVDFGSEQGNGKRDGRAAAEEELRALIIII